MRGAVNSNKLSLVLIAIGTVLIVAAGALFVVWWQAYNDAHNNSDLRTITAFGDSINLPAQGEAATPDPNLPPPSDAPIVRLVIPKVEINAPVVVKGVDGAGVMESPDNGYDTAWYDFSARPGYGGNAVFSGHVDYINIGAAVFWDLKDLEQGDIIQVWLEDGTIYHYAVNFRQQFDVATAPVDQIVGPTPRDTVTLITCSGSFDSASGQYDKRLVVRAERIIDGEAPPAPAPPIPGT